METHQYHSKKGAVCLHSGIPSPKKTSRYIYIDTYISILVVYYIDTDITSLSYSLNRTTRHKAHRLQVTVLLLCLLDSVLSVA